VKDQRSLRTALFCDVGNVFYTNCSSSQKKISFTLYLIALSLEVSLLLRQLLSGQGVMVCLCITPLDLALLIMLILSYMQST
ncbi:MAG TPA: hypothetical protein EYP08_08915, partial [Pyrodictiaceae archaeon]|nr:hypothetical protein [Pyrodictiaceae archaeon]